MASRSPSAQRTSAITSRTSARRPMPSSNACRCRTISARWSKASARRSARPPASVWPSPRFAPPATRRSGPSPRTSIPPARAVPAAQAVRAAAGRFRLRFPVHQPQPRKGCGLVVGQPFEHPFADVAAQVEQRGRILGAHQQPHLDRIAPRVGHLHHLHTAVPARIVRDLAFEFGADRADPGRRVEIEHHRTQQLRGFLGPVLEGPLQEPRSRHDQPPLVPDLRPRRSPRRRY